MNQFPALNVRKQTPPSCSERLTYATFTASVVLESRVTTDWIPGIPYVVCLHSAGEVRPIGRHDPSSPPTGHRRSEERGPRTCLLSSRSRAGPASATARGAKPGRGALLRLDDHLSESRGRRGTLAGSECSLGRVQSQCSSTLSRSCGMCGSRSACTKC